MTVPEGVMLISPASTADALSDIEDEGLFARTAPPDGLQGVALADRMEKVLGNLKGKTINIGARNDLYGTGFADSLAKELENRGAQRSAPRSSTTPNSRATTPRRAKSSPATPTTT